MLYVVTLSILSSLFSATYTQLSNFIHLYGYAAILGLMILESASMPIPSELLLPAAGYFSSQGALYLPFTIVIVLIGSFVGMAINYYIAYFIGKDIIYKHLRLFHIKKESLEAFEEWFKNNGAFAVFISRMLPLVRGLINFPAGFALMDPKKFYSYSMLGAAIWDIALVLFGYAFGTYAFSEQSNIVVLSIAVAAFGIVLYAIYRIAMSRIKKQNATRA